MMNFVPFTVSLTVLACCFSRQEVAVQVRLFSPSPPAAMKVMVEVVSQLPREPGNPVCETALVRLGTLHENTGGCDGHVCVTEHETLMVEPASTSFGTWVITGFSREAEHIKHSRVFCQLKSKQVRLITFKGALVLIPDLS